MIPTYETVVNHVEQNLLDKFKKSTLSEEPRIRLPDFDIEPPISRNPLQIGPSRRPLPGYGTGDLDPFGGGGNLFSFPNRGGGSGMPRFL